MRIALHSVLRDGHEAAYEKDHATIPEDLAAAFMTVGIHDWTIWRSGRDLFHLVDCDDFDSAMQALEDDPANVRWQRFINRHVDSVVPDPERPGTIGMSTVWSFGDQLSSGTST